MLKQAESFRVALGEDKGQSFYRARLTMKSTAAADQVKAIAEGFRAMVSLMHGSDAQVMKLLSGLKLSGDGKKFNVRWSASADDVWPVIEKAAQKWAEHKGKGHGCPMCRAAATGKCPLHGDAHKGKPCPPPDEDEFSVRQVLQVGQTFLSASPGGSLGQTRLVTTLRVVTHARGQDRQECLPHLTNCWSAESRISKISSRAPYLCCWSTESRFSKAGAAIPKLARWDSSRPAISAGGSRPGTWSE